MRKSRKHLRKSSELSLHARIAAWRHHFNLSQQDLESKAGLSHNAISRIENANVSPRIETVERIASAMEMSVEELQFRDPPIAKDTPNEDEIFQPLCERLSRFDDVKRREIVRIFQKLLDNMRYE